MIVSSTLTDKASNVVQASHGSLHLCRRVSVGFEEVLADNDIAKDTLVVSVKDEDGRSSSVLPISQHQMLKPEFMRKYIDIHIVSRSPEPPRYFRAIIACGQHGQDRGIREA